MNQIQSKANHRSTIIIGAVILVIILTAPLVFTLPFFWERFNYSITGQIGDTIGGITAPFINGLAAILVFITFREQVKANEMLRSQESTLRNQEDFRTLMQQISAIEKDNDSFDAIVSGVANRRMYLGIETVDETFVNLLDRALFFLSEFELARTLIAQYQGDKNFPTRKLNYLYTIRFRASLNKLARTFDGASVSKTYKDLAHEITSTINDLDKDFLGDSPRTWKGKP